jgi:hypothetical protein
VVPVAEDDAFDGDQVSKINTFFLYQRWYTWWVNQLDELVIRCLTLVESQTLHLPEERFTHKH